MSATDFETASTSVANESLRLVVDGVDKQFTLHTQGGTQLDVVAGASFEVYAGDCLALAGPSGSGKSTLLRCLYGNYEANAGSIRVRHGDSWVDIAGAAPTELLALRRYTMSWVSQFLRVIPRVPTIDVVADSALAAGIPVDEAYARSRSLLHRLGVPERLFALPPATFSGGEQQRVNLARGLVAELPILLVDEPTASLDARHRDLVLDVLEEARDRGSALIGIFHDPVARARLATRVIDVESFTPLGGVAVPAVSEPRAAVRLRPYARTRIQTRTTDIARTDRQIIRDAHVVLHEGVVHGDVTFVDGVITAISPYDDAHVTPSFEASTLEADATVTEANGDYLIAGLVDIHTDALEWHLRPRTTSPWPATAALIGHDAALAACGITTVLDSLRVGDLGSDGFDPDVLSAIVQSITELVATGSLRIDHLLHLRCEVADPRTPTLFEALCEHPALRLVSLMDHTPGIRQYRDIERYRANYGDDADGSASARIARLQERNRQYSAQNWERIAAICRARAIPLASHDDATPEDVEMALRSGVTVSEFPTSEEAARAAKSHGMLTVAGSPNVIRGGSHSGNVSAAHLASEGLLDVLSSDYVPSSLLHAPFVLASSGALSLAAAMRLVNDGPARAAGLTDRGRIAVGLRADLVRVHLVDDVPVVRGVWRLGKRIG